LCGKYKQSALLEHRHLSAETESSICCKIYPFAFLRLLQRERFVNNSFFFRMVLGNFSLLLKWINFDLTIKQHNGMI
jgi:hypothetical protein